MTIEATLAEMRVRDMEGRVHNFVSSVGNALERVDILIDGDELEEAKREIAELREALGHISEPPTYVTIYDVGEDESYYGYFASADEAEKLYRDLSHGDPAYHNAKICMVVKDLP